MKSWHDVIKDMGLMLYSSTFYVSDLIRSFNFPNPVSLIIPVALINSKDFFKSTLLNAKCYIEIKQS